MRDLEGNPVTLTEKVDGKNVTRPVRFEDKDVWRFLVDNGNLNHIIRARATGGGAPTSGMPSGWRPSEQPPTPKPTPNKANYGLK
ncbi:hypothetical protein D3C84_913990 [compost metagenome]